MINRNNLTDVLTVLGFAHSDGLWSKSIGDMYNQLTVDCARQEIGYPQQLKINDKTTCNFSHPENFVVFECVHRLLEKGYRPEHIELERRWTLGHEQKSGKADITVTDHNSKTLLIIECKTAGQEYNSARKSLLTDGGQLFSYWQQERGTQWLALYASDFDDETKTLSYKDTIVCCTDDSNTLLTAKTDDSIRLFSKAHTVQELFATWQETYNRQIHEGLIFGPDSSAYHIGIQPLRKRDLKHFSQEDAIVNRFDEQAFVNKDTITADFLWDFVLKEFTDDVVNYGAVTERWNTYKHRAAHEGAATEAVFKGVLLLNAFNNVAKDDSVTPSKENVRLLFAGTRHEGEVDGALNWLNDESVIQRTPGGIFSVQFSALPSHEIEETKARLCDQDFRHTAQVLKWGETARNHFEGKYVQRVIRPYVFDFFSSGVNDSLVKNGIKTLKKNARPSDLCLALFFARNHQELAHLQELAEACSQAGREEDRELGDIVYVVVETPWEERNYDRFIEYMASYTAAGNHGFIDQVNVHRQHAEEMVKDWMTTAQRGNCTLWVGGRRLPIAVKHLSSSLNDVVAPLLFPKGPDALDLLRQRSPSTFWKPQVPREIIRTIIFATTKEELLALKGAVGPIQYLVQNALDDNLDWKPDMPEGHPLREVHNFVNRTIRNFISHGNTANLFDFTERFDELTRPPFGLAGNYASAAMMAFALRPWVNKMYDSVGKPRTADNLADDIALLFKYWENGKQTNRLCFKLQTPQEGKLCKELVRLFRLDQLPGHSGISSMKDTRFALTGGYVAKRGYPLWSLKHMTDEFTGTIPPLTMNDEVRRLVDNIVAICEEKDLRNVQLVTDTLALIDRYRVDFQNILAREGAFENGFHHFLMEQPGVRLQEEELGEAKTFIEQNLQSTIGYWTEQEVVDKLKDWRIDQANRADEAKRQREEEERRQREAESQRKMAAERKAHEAELERARKLIGKPDNVQRKKMLARERIDALNSPEQLREILDRLINLGYEGILDAILNNGD